jgi:putative thioredoxin
VSNVPPPGANLRGAVDLSALVRRANAAAPQPGAPASDGDAPADSLVFDASDATFQRIIDLSARVPVVVEFYMAGLEPALGPIVASYGGRLALATVDASGSPQLAQAFRVSAVPFVAAVLAGQPVDLFPGIPAEEQVRQVFDQLLQLAAQNGVNGTLAAGEPGDPSDPDAPAPEPAEEPLPPHHQEAYDAIARGDYAEAVKEYETAIAQNPRDALAVAGLAQASLLQRLDGADAAAIRAAAAERRDDVGAQLAVADLDVSGGHLDDAFDRLLELFPALDQAGKDAVRQRLLQYFEIAGPEDPRVVTARRRLTSLLY